MENWTQLKILFENEEWRPVVGYEGLYEVSNMGRVKSLPRNGTKGGILKPAKNKLGYLRIVLCKNNIHKNTPLHRIVALAFIPNPDPEHKTQVNHINEDKTDNRACNLNWMTPKENTNWGTGKVRCHITGDIKQRNNSKTSKPVKQMNLDGTIVKIWPSTAEAQRNGFNACDIVMCANGRENYKTHRGYRWAYLS